MKKADFGLIGLGVMGANLARNIASHRFSVLVWNRTQEKMKEFIARYGNEYLQGKENLLDFVSGLELPRKIMIMVTAGDALDQVIDELAPLFQKGDIIIDGGNSFFRDTMRREEHLGKRGIHFVGCGISGGAYGALHGPCLMVGGSKESYQSLWSIFAKLAAKDFSEKPCVAHLGPNGAGHYVKMVHNGIEYALMQLIAEAYSVLREGYGLPADRIADIFESFAQGELSSYLLEIAIRVLRREDDLADGFLVDHILPQAEEKGTGRSAVIDALERGVPVPMMAASVFARLTSFVSGGYQASEKTHYQMPEALPQFQKTLEKALVSAFYLAYQEGLSLLAKASEDMHWNIDLKEVIRIWQGGCIIRATLLSKLQPPPYHPPAAQGILNLGSPCSFPPSANLIQGMRDYFGSHGYGRTDRDGIFHTDWKK